MPVNICRAIAPLLVLSSLTRAVGAQPSAQLAVVSGTATDQRGLRSQALTVAPSLRLLSTPRVALELSGAATRFGTEAHSIGGGAAVGGSLPLGTHLTIVSSANASLAQTSFDATFRNTELLGSVEGHWRAVTLFAGSRFAQGFSAAPAVASPGFPDQRRRISQSRSAIGPIGGLRVLLVGQSTTSGSFAAQVARWKVDGVVVEDRSLSAVLANPRLTLTGSLGRRAAVDEERSFATAQGVIGVTPWLSLTLGAGSYPSDRLNGAAAGKFVTAGLVLRTGGPRSPRALRVPNEPPPARGWTRFTIRARGATRVELAGDWNEWARIPARRAAGDIWFLDLPLAAGEYRYAFVVDGDDWRVPKDAVAVDDGFGGRSAIIAIRGDRGK